MSFLLQGRKNNKRRGGNAAPGVGGSRPSFRSTTSVLGQRGGGRQGMMMLQQKPTTKAKETTAVQKNSLQPVTPHQELQTALSMEEGKFLIPTRRQVTPTRQFLSAKCKFDILSANNVSLFFDYFTKQS